MLESIRGAIRRLDVSRAIATLALVPLSLLWISSAGAIPLYFNGPNTNGDGNLGIAETDSGPLPDVSSAVADGVPVIDPISTFLATDFGFVTPDPITANTNRPASPSLADPVTGSTVWQVTNGTGTSYQDLWLVFRGLSPLDANGFVGETTGLEVTGPSGAFIPGTSWALLHVVDGTDEFWYPSLFLGDVASGATVPASLDYRVLEDPYGVNDDYTFPRLRIGLATAVPEPTTLVLVGAGLALVSLERRRSR